MLAEPILENPRLEREYPPKFNTDTQNYSQNWNIPMFNRKYIFNPGPFSIAMLDYRNVHVPKHHFGNPGYLCSTTKLPSVSTSPKKQRRFTKFDAGCSEKRSYGKLEICKLAMAWRRSEWSLFVNGLTRDPTQRWIKRIFFGGRVQVPIIFASCLPNHSRFPYLYRAPWSMAISRTPPCGPRQRLFVQ